MIYLITLIGLVFRLVLANQSFWLDEGASIMAARVPLSQFFTYLKADFQPPLYYLFLKLWLPLAGNSEWLIRLPGILIGTATIPLVFLLCRKLLGKNSKIPFIAALFLALNPFHVYYSQELRMYALSAFFVLLSWLALLDEKYIWVSLTNLLSLFTFYGAGFNLVSQGLYLLFSKKKDFGKFLLSIIPLIICFYFWWPIFNAQLSGGGYLQTALPGWQVVSGSLTLKSLLLIPIKFLIGRINLDPQKLYFVVGGLLILLFFGLCLLSLKNKKGRLLWFYFLIPLILATLISFKTPILGYWRYLFVLPPFLCLVAIGLLELPQKLRLFTTVTICLIFISANLYFWLNPTFHREDWRGFTRMVNGQHALVIIPFSGVFAPLTFYQSDAFYLPAQTNLGQTPADLATKLAPMIQKYQTIYVMDYLSDLSDPGRKILNTVREMESKEKAVYNFTNLGQVFKF